MLTFYHAPQSRSFSILWLLEELGEPYSMELIDIRGEDGAPESYRAIQAHKKVPALAHDGVIVTERAAISLYLADAFPRAGLAPAIGDPSRAAYLTALVYADAVLDPVIAAKALGVDYPPRNVSFGSLDDAVAHLESRLAQGHAAGGRFTAADTQLGTAVHYGMNIVGVLPRRPVFEAYMTRMLARPALQRTLAKEEALAKGA
ncbi:MAG TPA: glutathione S-transferase [Bosea sp. (in: a-proteobacteria)]|uniref:glutathione S-transferase family protein n=1 Tax=Bosea sp. (in: a-proteobacteria) TaxID=1871050 RepID=UPI002E129BA9|nr:glutathione S-transferase [Bosea sp. (in: a-proteobacteria)]